MNKVVLATGNPGKVEEMQRELQAFGLDVVPQSDFNIPEAIEDGLSFVENAIKKARHACQHTGLPSIADDSGLEVDALAGAPGIYSARYADGQGDAANNIKLLSALEGQQKRTARYQCVIAFMRHAEDPTPILCHGSWEGEIALTAAGNNGFGYDPIFYVAEHNCTAAELEAKQKKHLSHRAKALALLKQALQR
ncbi:MAG: XTP/dITP diphosphohydrolase [Arenicella sp.]|jgi:XTP/dITP diphosphohydrolase